ncbi:hypothetical protein BGZ99_010188 [Dissophora globulifera]|uniref:DUF3752 domain-containing protein n=1 Tax=Dissophora globulifera TaxID=979702 RepID=A0A9P6RSU9_9FUNG|nr:hypothetical protein BGZ99_010188 [Dissophora globulifera]
MGIGPELPPHLQKSRAAAATHNKQDYDDGSGDDLDNIVPSVGPSIGPSIGSSIGPSRPPPQEESVTTEDFAPALPPELVEARRIAREKAQQASSTSTSKRVLGPSLPSSVSIGSQRQYDEDDSDDDIVGPVLPSDLDREALSKQSRIREFEERAERMRKKLNKVDEDDQATFKDTKTAREEWMMVPPESRLLGDDPLKVTARTFQKRELKPQDSSLWTETPGDREKRLRGDPRDGDGESSQRKKSKRRDDDDDVHRSQEDIDREERIRQYNAKNRSESLFDAHSTKYVKSKAWQKETEDNPSARPFDREKDVLGGRRIDHRQRDELVKQASDLGSKFARGKGNSFM